MSKNDVVKHDLSAPESIVDWDADVPPVESELDLGGPEVAPSRVALPKTGMITGEALTKKPHRSVGQLRMKFSDGNMRGASGWVVSKRAFITAGHCIYKKDLAWVSAAEFCPRYDAGCKKAFSVTTVYTLQGWIDDQQDRRYDLAACVVDEEFASTEPPLSFQLFFLPPLEFSALGYPITPNSRHDFNGKRFWQSDGDCVAYKDDLLFAENDLTGGASGGPWIDRATGDVAGLNAARGNNPDLMWSPVFRKGFENLYDAVKKL